MKKKKLLTLLVTAVMSLTMCMSACVSNNGGTPSDDDSSDGPEIIGGENHTHSWSSVYESDAEGHWKECSGCDEKEEEAPHTFGNWQVEKAATESEGGREYRECNICGYTEYRDTVAIPHEHAWASAWSSDDDYHWHECATCDDVNEKGAHEWDDGEVTTEPTETTEGIRTYTCKTCHKTKTEPVAALGHTHSPSKEWSSDDTQHWHACSGCNEKVDAENHTYKDGVCECGHKDPDYVAPHEHVAGTKWEVNEIQHWHECTECGEPLAAAEHKFENGYCKDCNYKDPDYVPPHEHVAGSEWKSNDDKHWKECECGEKLNLEDHTWNGGEITKPATATSDGVKTFTCIKCGQTKTETIPATGGGTDTPTEEKVTVTYMYGSTKLGEKQINKGTADSVPTYSIPGYYITGWYTNPDFTGSAYNFSTVFNADTTLYAKVQELSSSITYYYAGNESAAFEWTESTPSGARVEYKLAGESDNKYVQVESSLIRAIDSDTARVDIVGLKGDTRYDFRITDGAGKKMTVTDQYISAYDRSGYAHFNYTEGVGAYNDDGSLKDGALVIYLTDGNKEDITDSAYTYSAATNSYTKVPASTMQKYFAYPAGQTITLKYTEKSTEYSENFVASYSIGYFLNNRNYTTPIKDGKEVGGTIGGGIDKYGIKAACDDYGAVVIRVVGTVNAEDTSDGAASLISGLTVYDSVYNAGSVGDNGRMARIVDAYNLTIEGVGTDASLKGWGIHFIASGSATGNEGKSFEVRNITFANYPEDALGMEGQQDGDVITSSVERCWIHNNTFLPGYSQNPAESDKAEGDGSCDFKRGMYYTLSYNYFKGCHKTNLIGSSDTSLQYNISIHHNWWEDCGSRIPLVRNSNVHFYNNYVSLSDAVENLNVEISYVTSARANSYVFQEGNYFEGCKNVTKNDGGHIKAYNNIYYACYELHEIADVTDRTQTVTNNCQYAGAGIDFSTFDTNPDLFYYNAQTKQSDCYLTDAVTAREECIKYAGVLKYDYTDIDTSLNKTTPSSTVAATKEGLTIDLSQAGANSVISGVVFTNGKGSSSGYKGKGQLITFTLARDTEVSVTSSTTGDNSPYLVGSDGKVWASKFTNVEGLTLPAGTYVISSGNLGKEATITSLKFVDGATDEEKIAEVEAAIDLIPSTVTLDSECVNAINSASAMYNALSSNLQSQVTNADKLTSAIATLDTLRVNNVVSLIEKIGTVSVENDYLTEITAAREAYNALSTANQAKVTNYQKLVDAEIAYANIAVEALQNRIGSIAAPSADMSREQIETLLDEYKSVETAYADLDSDQKAEIKDYSKITDGMEALQGMLKPYELADMVDALPDSGWTSEHNSAISAAKTLYESLNDAQRAVLTPEQVIKLEAAIDYYEAEMAKTIVVCFQRDADASYYSALGVTVTGSYKDNKTTYTYNGVTYYGPLKMESKTVVTFTIGEDRIVTLQFDEAGKVQIDGVEYTSNSSGTLVVTGLSAGTHTITRVSGNSQNLQYMVIGS